MTKKYIIVEESSYEDALFKGLNILNLTENDVEVEIIEEKKSFLFKKGSYKLKITPIINIDVNEDTPKKDDYPPTEEVEDEIKLDYRSDGVYLTLPQKLKDNTSDIIDFLNKRSVKNYDYGKIVELIENEEKFAQKIAPYQEEILIDSKLHVYTNKNKLETVILLTQPIGGKVLSASEIVQRLKEEGIVFGINKEKIEEVVENKIFNQKIIVAEGKLPINGDDGKIIYNFDDELEGPSIVEKDGRIDYKNLNKIRNVRTDDIVIEIIPPTEGISGMDVYGHEIISKKGNPIFVKKGKNVRESEDGSKIYASKDGEVYFSNNTVYVDEVITISGNVDNETGNIQFNGKVNIKGNVRTGFKVEAEGDIEVFGVVESATLISKKNITIHRGIQGNNNAYLHCLGDFKSKYVENANIRSAGNVEADVILHSDIIAKNKVIVKGKKGLIVGGSIKAGEEVRANIIGSNMGTNTTIEVGIDPEEKDKYEHLKSEIENIEKNIESSKKAVDLLTKMSKQGELVKNKQELLIKSLKTYEVLKQKKNLIMEELEILSEKLHDNKNGKIHSSVIIYPGVKVIIGNYVRQIYDLLNNTTLYIKDGEVTIGPYEK